MRLVAIADTHGNHQGFEVPDGDVLIHAGDLTGKGKLQQVIESLDWLASLPHRHKLLVAGNHDFLYEQQPEQAALLTKAAGITYLLDSEVRIDGVRFWGSPWQPRFFDWAFNLDRGEPLEQKWRLIPEGIDVLITHGPPLGHGDRCFDGQQVGCERLLSHLSRVQPKLHFFGHIHEDRGESRVGQTRVINCTTSICDMPATVVDL